MPTPRWPELLLAGAAAAVLLAAGAARADEAAPRTTPAGWQSLLGGRPAAQLGQRQIVVLRLPSLAERLQRAGGFASETQMRAWTAAAEAGQRNALVRLARRGAAIQPEHAFVRVLNGFAASLDARSVALLERDPQVEGVYPVRAAYPAALPGPPELADALGERRTAVSLTGFDGSGVTVALLDTGVDAAHPYLGGRLLEGIDVLAPGAGAVAQADPTAPYRLERHGTQLAGIVAGRDGPGGLHGVAPGAVLLPIRVAGWQPDASGGVAVYARTDQVLAGLEAAVDPNGNGDVLDAARIALVGVVEPFAAFADGPLARAVAGALALDTLVVVPAGNEGPAGPAFGSVGGPGGAPAALTVGAADLRASSPGAHVLLRSGLGVLLGGEQPLGGGAVPERPFTVRVVALASTERLRGAIGASSYFDRRGFSRVAGAAVLLPSGMSSPESVREAAAAGARAVLVDALLPAGSLAAADVLGVPVLGVPAVVARAARTQLAGGAPVSLSVGAPVTGANPDAAGVAPFSSRGLAFGGGFKPELVAGGVAVPTAEPGQAESGEAVYGTVSGSSAAAAVVAGAAALLAQARPELDAAALRSALVAGARPATGDPAGAGAGLVDVQRAAGVELVADPPLASLGSAPPAGKATVTLRNVSRRLLVVEARPPARGRAGAAVSVAPRRLRLRPGASADVTLSRSLAAGPALPAWLRGSVVLLVEGGSPLRVPWALALPPRGRALLSRVRLARREFAPSDARPVLLQLVAGRVDGPPGRPRLQPLERLELELHRRGRRIGTLAVLRNVLPGSYAFGITGRGPRGRRLPRGSYELRLVATSVAGARTSTAVAFRVG